MITGELYEIEAHRLAAGYYINGDFAHMEDHMQAVKKRAVDMRTYLQGKNIDSDLTVVLISAIFHDIGSMVQREDHADESVKIVSEFFDKGEFKDLTDYQKLNILNSIAQHSSHFDDAYYSIESEILASADRDEPDIYNILYRSTLYGLKYNPDNVLDSVAEYNIARYAKFPSKEYRVPDWHFDYWNDTTPLYNDTTKICDTLNIFFSNEEAVKTVIQMIIDRTHYTTVQDYIAKTLNHKIYSESFVPKFIRFRNT